jgi:hypothetical protein
MVKPFISHSSQGEKLAKALVTLIMGCIEIDTADVRCTSVAPYKLYVGAQVGETLRREIGAAVVIGLITPNSLRSPWVLSEFGAAWALGRLTLPCLALGAQRTEVKGPLESLHMIELSSRQNVVDLIDTLVSQGGFRPRSPAQQNVSTDDFVATLLSIPETQGQPEQICLQGSIKADPRLRLRWADIAHRLKHELLVVGWSCDNVMKAGTEGHFRRMLAAGKRVNFLIQDRAAFGSLGPLEIRHVCAKASDQAVVDDILNAEKSIRAYYATWPTDARRNFELRATRWLMAWSGVALDLPTKEGPIQVEIYNYDNPDLDRRTNVIVSPNSPAYEGLRGSLEAIWNNASKVTL